MLAVESLTKRFGSTVAVDDLSFEVPTGRVVGFLGPNGAGKSTTLRALLGLVVPTSGSALIDGTRYVQLADPIRTVGSMLEGRFHPGRTGRNHLRVLARAGGLPRDRVEDVLRLVELEGSANRRVKGYSQGMRQRLGLAAALLGDPEILILDEPANGLDPQGIRWLRDFLVARGGEGRTVLVSSHVLSEVALTVDSIVVINRGKLVTQGTVAELTGGRGVLVRSPDDGRLAEVLRGRGIEVESRADGGLWVSSDGSSVGDAALAAGIALHELSPRSQSLEDYFLELTGSAEIGDEDG